MITVCPARAQQRGDARATPATMPGAVDEDEVVGLIGLSKTLATPLRPSRHSGSARPGPLVLRAFRRLALSRGATRRGLGERPFGGLGERFCHAPEASKTKGSSRRYGCGTTAGRVRLKGRCDLPTFRLTRN
jgi:hypothetical protein